MAEREVRIGERQLTVDRSAFQVEPLGGGVYIAGDDTHRVRVVVAGTPDDLWVFADGRVAQVELVDRGRRRARRRLAGDDMRAPMPATVLRVYVEPGARVVRGDTVLMLEAMKMELPIRASRDGVVRAVLCKPGELVQPGVPLVDIAP